VQSYFARALRWLQTCSLCSKNANFGVEVRPSCVRVDNRRLIMTGVRLAESVPMQKSNGPRSSDSGILSRARESLAGTWNMVLA